MDKLMLILGVCVVIIFSVVLYQANNECTAKGGRLVRGIVWYVCIQGRS